MNKRIEESRNRVVLVVILLFCVFSQGLWSQVNPSANIGGGILSGVIIDSTTNKPMDYVQVRLLNWPDSSVVSGIYSNEKGEFLLDGIVEGTFFARIYFTGYAIVYTEKFQLSASKIKHELGTIVLKPEVLTNLQEVKVIGKQELMQTGIDKKVYNVAEDLSSQGGTANEVLSKVPSVDVDQDGNISLRGEANVTILIDGRPSSLSGGNGKSLLDAIPASSIERIEIVTNPSAKYSPDGTAGIINVVLKKNKLRGTNGAISLSAANGPIANGSANFSYRNQHVNAYVSYTNRYSEGYRNNKGSLQQTYTADSIARLVQDRVGTDLDKGHTLRVGADFYLKPNQTLGLALTGTAGERNRWGDQSNKLYDENSNLLSDWSREAYDPSQNRNMDANLNYKINLKEDKGELIVDVTQSLGQSKIGGQYLQRYITTDGLVSSQPNLQQQITNEEKNDVSTAQLDYTRVFSKSNIRLEAGAKSIVRNLGVNTHSETFDITAQQFLSDTLSNFKYSYNEQVYGAYGIVAKQFGKFKTQGGVRLEQAYQTPFLESSNEKYKNDYFSAYPSAHIKYIPREANEWSLSYSRRVHRAESEDMNPFTSYADPYNLRKGNPALKPEFINSFDLGYAFTKKKITITSSVFVRHSTNVIQRLKVFYADNTSALTFGNIDQSLSSGLELVVVANPVKWWRNIISFNGSTIKYIDNSSVTDYNKSGFNWGFKYVGSFEFWKKTMTAQLNWSYNAPWVRPQGTVQRRGGVDLSTEKSLKDGKWKVGVRVTDIFNQVGFTLNLAQNNVEQSAEFKWLTRRYYLTVSYKFGKYEVNPKKSSSEGGGMDY